MQVLQAFEKQVHLLNNCIDFRVYTCRYETEYGMGKWCGQMSDQTRRPPPVAHSHGAKKAKPSFGSQEQHIKEALTMSSFLNDIDLDCEVKYFHTHCFDESSNNLIA